MHLEKELFQGETENAEVVTALLTDLRDRGLCTNRPTLFCLDRSKALAAAVNRIFGMNAVIQRCQMHKLRNVEGHFPKKHQPEAHRRMRSNRCSAEFAKSPDESNVGKAGTCVTAGVSQASCEPNKASGKSEDLKMASTL